jgi:hypothetical protein
MLLGMWKGGGRLPPAGLYRSYRFGRWQPTAAARQQSCFLLVDKENPSVRSRRCLAGMLASRGFQRRSRVGKMPATGSRDGGVGSSQLGPLGPQPVCCPISLDGSLVLCRKKKKKEVKRRRMEDGMRVLRRPRRWAVVTKGSSLGDGQGNNLEEWNRVAVLQDRLGGAAFGGSSSGRQALHRHGVPCAPLAVCCSAPCQTMRSAAAGARTLPTPVAELPPKTRTR